MDPRLLSYYEQELVFLREMGQEFADRFPKVASRLGLEELECADPYVERLLEGAAFLAARVHLKQDDEFPHFAANLLDVVYPHFRTPVPATSIVQFEPDYSDSALAEGPTVARGTSLFSELEKDQQTRCEFRTARDVRLWPIKIISAKYLPTTAAVDALGLPKMTGTRAAIQLTLRSTADVALQDLELEDLPLYFDGEADIAQLLFEQIQTNAIALLGCPPDKPGLAKIVRESFVEVMGFADNEALFPAVPRAFSGYRLLQEFFSCPERFRSLKLKHLNRLWGRKRSNTVEIYILLDQSVDALEAHVEPARFKTFTSPIVNLFPRKADRIHISPTKHQYHVVVDRTRPLDFEVHSLERVQGFATDRDATVTFRPYFEPRSFEHSDDHAFYTVERAPRKRSTASQTKRHRSTYLGNEMFLSLVDETEKPIRSDIRTVAVDTLCTNRDLPLLMRFGKSESDFSGNTDAPVNTIKALISPTRPRNGPALGSLNWKFIRHLNLGYYGLSGSDTENIAALRDMLRLYVNQEQRHLSRLIDGIVGFEMTPITRRMPFAGPASIGRGIEIRIIFEDEALQGTSAIMVGNVIERFLARYVSINSFTQTCIETVNQGEIHRWPVRIGSRHAL